ncbi:MAG TPA: tRNA (guanosine(37)-N1)-methyltransferase TrmD [Kiritimatiellia bacterium]|nr:tRNA (guanosine(37)-N1)-methyltransferase TrmD [Kiritimatiellia bacterium]
MLEIDVITIFPDMLDGVLGRSMMKRAVDQGAAVFRMIDLRDFTTDRHRTTDDRPYGGGPGMVMTCDPLFKAVASVRRPESRVILMSPSGRVFKQAIARDMSRAAHLVFICGHYEGIDERVRLALVDDELSIGDYVLTNGVLPAAVVIDATVRLLPGVLGGEGATEQESFTEGLLEYPHYTRPEEYAGMRVPEVLLSGDHAAIRRWREDEARTRTAQRRPDLLASDGEPVREG